jgi:PAS domain S-box-containing protein
MDMGLDKSQQDSISIRRKKGLNQLDQNPKQKNKKILQKGLDNSVISRELIHYFIISKDCIITETNHLFANILGYSIEEIANKNICDLMVSKDASNFKNRLALNKDYPIKFTCYLYEKKITESGSITFGCILKDNYIEMHVKDTGIGNGQTKT